MLRWWIELWLKILEIRVIFLSFSNSNNNSMTDTVDSDYVDGFNVIRCAVHCIAFRLRQLPKWWHNLCVRNVLNSVASIQIQHNERASASAFPWACCGNVCWFIQQSFSLTFEISVRCWLAIAFNKFKNDFNFINVYGEIFMKINFFQSSFL